MAHQIDIEKVLVRELMEDSPDYIFIKDRESRFVITNKAQAQLLLGLENPEDAIGKTDFDLFPGRKEDAQRFYDEEQSIMETGQPVIRREWMVPSTATKEIVWLSESKLPIRNESGEIVGLIGLGRDVSERKTAQLLTGKLSYQLETVVQVTRIANDILDPRELTEQIVDLVRDRFEFYYVGLFIVDQEQRLDSKPGQYAVLRAATGDVGKILISKGHKLEVGGDSMVGQCIKSGKSHVVKQNIASKEKRFANPLLPDTHTEMVLPLISRMETLGALNIQSTVDNAFTEQDVSVFEVLASLLAASLQNAFLFQKLEEEIKATKEDLKTYVRGSWSNYLKK